MTMFKRLLAITVSVAGLVAFSDANATPYKFVVIDPTLTQNGVALDNNSYTFFFDSAPAPTGGASDSFSLTGSAYYTAGVFGAYRVDGTFTFYTDPFAGFDSPLNIYFSDQLFTGTTSAPVFKLGTFQTDVGSITISAVNAGAVPEPATWGMMIAGFGLIGGAMRYRRRETKVAYA